MRPIPAPRLGDTHGLLRAINQRERLRLDEFITEFSVEELFPPGLENALGRTRQFVSYARSAGLLKEDRGTVELTEIGKRYVRAGDESAIFDVASEQAEWLRRQLRERHMTDSIYHGAAIGLSLYASNPPDFHATNLDFGRALAYLGRAGWDNENTLESQGERYTTFLRDLELIDDDRRLTATGTQVKGELTLPIHMSLRDLAGQLNPGGPDAAQAEGEAEWAARAGGAAAEPAEADPAPAEAPAPAPAAEQEAASETGEYEEVRGSTAPVDRTPAAPADRPVPPSDLWETAAPDEATRAYSTIKPEQAAAAAVGAGAIPEEAADVEGGAGPDLGGAVAGAGVPAGSDVGVDAPDAAVDPPGAAVAPEPEVVTPPAPPVAPEPEVVTPEPEAVALEPEPAGAEPIAVDGPGVRSAAPEVPDAEVVESAPPAAPSPAAAPSTRRPSGFLDLAAVRAAAEASGLDLPDSVYANLVAALASGKHLVISGPAGSGKTTLALAVAKAAVQAGRSAGAALATASPKWSAHDTVGRVGDSGFRQGHVLAAAGRKKWLVIDELDRAKLDKAFGDLSSFLGGLPLSLPDGSREVAAPVDWRIVATRDSGRGPLEASPALLRRFAQVHLPQPERVDLERAIDAAADGDATAAAAVKRLLAADLPGLGAGAYLDAARHAAERNALSPASEEELADECMAAYIAPHLRQADDPL